MKKRLAEKEGTITLSRDGQEWLIQAPPHVVMRLKNVFAKISDYDHGTIHLSVTPENCRDLEWFLDRYPMAVLGSSVLVEQARLYDAKQDASRAILDGRYELPDYEMALPPREYQRSAATLAINNGGLLVADDLGLGKTITAITMLADPSTLPAIIIVPAHLPGQWERELNRFLPGLRTHVIKTRKLYPLANADGDLPDVLITTYSKVAAWADYLGGNDDNYTIKSIVFDEVQELRHENTQKHSGATYIAGKATTRMGLSATPIHNYGGEFFTVLDLLSPGALGNRAEFLREWCGGGWSSKPRLNDPRAFGSYVKSAGLMVRRTKKDVSRELPALTKIVHEIESDTKVLDDVKYAADELANIILSQSKGWDVLKASQEFSNTLRQATGIAKAPYVAELVRMLIEQDQPVLLFGWHRAVYSLWQDRLGEYNPAWYTGSESPVKKAKEAARFMAGETPLMICSLRSGSGLDGLQAVCSTTVHGELDWSDAVHKQNIGRVHRDGQIHPVFAYFPVAIDGIDPVMVDVLGLKQQQLEGVIDPNGDMVIPKTADPNHIKKLARAYLEQRR